MNERDLSDLIGEIYDAAIEPGHWVLFLNDLLHRVRPDGKALLLLNDIFSRSDTIISSVNFEQQHLALYKDIMEKVNPWPAVAAHRAIGVPFTNESLVPFQELSHTVFYNEWLRPQALVGGPALVVTRDEGRSMVLTVLHGGGGEDSEGALPLLAQLAPHLTRAAQIHRQFRLMRFRREAAEEALNRLALGAVTLGGNGRIVFANHRADSILRRGDTLTMDHGGRLRAVSPSNGNRLDLLIHEAILTATRRGTGSGGVLALHRTGQAPMSVLVAPLHIGMIDRNEAAAIVFISDPDENTCPTPLALARLFSLTASEAKLLQRLAEGTSLKECAAEFGLSYATVRAQLASILRKTDCNRQTEVIRLALTSPVFLASLGVTD